jgi:hypothetical protein
MGIPVFSDTISLYILGGDEILLFLEGFFPIGFEFIDPGAHLSDLIPDSGRIFIILGIDEGNFFVGQLPGLLLEFTDGLGTCVVLHAFIRTGFVDEVDGLVRKMPFGDVTSGQFRGGAKRFAGICDVMMILIPFLDSQENPIGFIDGRFLDDDRLETSFQSRVLLDVLLVFVHRRGADTLQFSPAKSGV